MSYVAIKGPLADDVEARNIVEHVALRSIAKVAYDDLDQRLEIADTTELNFEEFLEAYLDYHGVDELGCLEHGTTFVWEGVTLKYLKATSIQADGKEYAEIYQLSRPGEEDCFIRVSGWYCSYEGFERTDVELVKPYTVLETVYLNDQERATTTQYIWGD